MYNVIGILLYVVGVAIYAKLSQYEFYRSMFDPAKPTFFSNNSWKRKYRDPMTPILKQNWYERLFGIQFKERFFLSSTLLVWLTDGFHLLQGVMIWCFTVTIVVTHYDLVARPWWWTLGYILFYRVLWSSTFTVFFNFIFKK